MTTRYEDQMRDDYLKNFASNAEFYERKEKAKQELQNLIFQKRQELKQLEEKLERGLY